MDWPAVTHDRRLHSNSCSIFHSFGKIKLLNVFLFFYIDSSIVQLNLKHHISHYRGSSSNNSSQHHTVGNKSRTFICQWVLCAKVFGQHFWVMLVGHLSCRGSIPEHICAAVRNNVWRVLYEQWLFANDNSIPFLATNGWPPTALNILPVLIVWCAFSVRVVMMSRLIIQHKLSASWIAFSALHRWSKREMCGNKSPSAPLNRTIIGMQWLSTLFKLIHVWFWAQKHHAMPIVDAV